MKHNIISEERKLIAIIRLRVPARAASAKEPVGPALGQYGISITDFCSRFNEMSQIYKEQIILNTTLFYYSDKKYDLFISLPNSSYFIIKAAALIKGNRRPGKLLNITPYAGVVNSPIIFEILSYLCKYNPSMFTLSYSTFKKLVHSIRSIGFLVI